MAIPVTFKDQTSSNTTMTIVIAVAVGVVTVLVLTVVLVVILIRRRRQQRLLNITPANDKPGDQSEAPDVVHYRNIGGGVARISSASAERRSSSSAVQADANVMQGTSGAGQYARVGASPDSHPYVYALPATSDNSQARPCTADDQLAAAQSVSTEQAGTEQMQTPLCPVVHPYVYALPGKSDDTADGQARMGTAYDQLAGGRSVSSKQAVTKQTKKPLPCHLTKKNSAAITSVTTVSSSDVIGMEETTAKVKWCVKCVQ